MRRLLALVTLSAAVHTGAACLFRHRRRQYAGSRKHILVVQGGLQLRPAGDQLDDTVVSVMMGGVVLDLRGARIVRPPAHLDVMCVMGGVTVVVPEGWKVRVDVQPWMGGVHDGRIGPIDADRSPDIVLSGQLMMGGLNIANVMPGERVPWLAAVASEG